MPFLASFPSSACRCESVKCFRDPSRDNLVNAALGFSLYYVKKPGVLVLSERRRAELHRMAAAEESPTILTT